MRKRSKISIIKAFYKILSDGKPHSFNEIATKIKTNWETIKNWAEILDFVQKQPEIEIIRNKLNLVRLKK
ncbi:MAG: hypothetical protein ACTSRS_17500 [Candidatus Helarchaeota archaeon]